MAFRQRIGHGMAKIGDTAFSNVRRSMHQMTGGRAGTQAYKTTLGNAQSMYTRELLDQKHGKGALRDIHKAMRFIKTYNERRLAKIIERNEGRPQKLEREVLHLAKKFAADISLFNAGLQKYVQSINDGLVTSNKEFGTNNELLISLLEQYNMIIKKHALFIPKELIDQVRKAIVHLEKKELKYARKESNFDAKLMQEDQAGDTHTKNVSWRKVTGLMKKDERAEIEELRENMRKMQEEIREERPQLSFLSYFQHHIQHLEQAAKAHERICLDFLMMIGRADEYFQEMKKSILHFEAMFSTYEFVKKLQTEMKEMEADHQALQETIKADITSQKQEYYVSKQSLHHIKALMDAIEQSSEQSIVARQEALAA